MLKNQKVKSSMELFYFGSSTIENYQNFLIIKD